MRKRLGCEKEVAAEWHFQTPQADRRAPYVAAMGKPAFLVEFSVIWQEALWHNAQQAAGANDQRTIIQPSIMTDRSTNQHHRAQCGARSDDFTRGALHCVQQRRLQVEIVECVRGQAKLGKDQ